VVVVTDHKDRCIGGDRGPCNCGAEPEATKQAQRIQRVLLTQHRVVIQRLLHTLDQINGVAECAPQDIQETFDFEALEDLRDEANRVLMLSAEEDLKGDPAAELAEVRKRCAETLDSAPQGDDVGYIEFFKWTRRMETVLRFCAGGGR
jgi:hypothetical protein